jgi:hypothetical protein
MSSTLPFKPIFAPVPADVPLVNGQFIISDNSLAVDIGGERKEILHGVREAITVLDSELGGIGALTGLLETEVFGN